MRDIKFSTTFPAKHYRAGENTFFIERIWAGLLAIGNPNIFVHSFSQHLHTLTGKIFLTDLESGFNKYTTIRAGKRWKVDDQFNPRIWTGKPYNSSPINFAPAITLTSVQLIHISIWDGGMTISINGVFFGKYLNKEESNSSGYMQLHALVRNDGFETVNDFYQWMRIHPLKKDQKTFIGQILSWNPLIKY